MDLTTIAGLMGGLGLFLYGMHMMGEGLEKAAGGRMRRLLEVLTSKKVLAVIVGALVTAIIQSSSATTVMVVGFVNAGLMNLYQAVGVIMGANIGTTITGQMIATLDMDIIAPILAFAGIIMLTMMRGKAVQSLGQVLAGLGILFIGMDTMSGAMKPLQQNEAFQNILLTLSNPVLGVIVGAVFTAVVQSSSAATGILQAFALQGLISLDTSIFILLGMNIGTCVTALISCIGASYAARRAAIIHLLFNLVGTVLFAVMILCLPVVDWIRAISPLGPMQEIANTHTIFNVVSTLMLLPASNLLVWLSMKLIRGQDPVSEPMALKYLTESALSNPMLAVSEVVREVERMGKLTSRNFRASVQSFIDGDVPRTKEILDNEQVINFLNHSITGYLVRINAMPLSSKENKMIGSFFHVVNDLERIGDHAENIVEHTRDRVENNVPFSSAALSEIEYVADKVQTILDESLEIFAKHRATPDTLDEITDKEEEIDEITEKLRDSHIQRLNEGLCSPKSGMNFVDLLINMERVSDHAANIAYSVNS